MSETSDRAARGVQASKEIVGLETGGPSPLGQAARDFVFSEVWTRPGLDRRSRVWITLACVCAAGAELPIRIYLAAAMDHHGISEAELREFVLQFAAYQGFPRASRVEFLLTEILRERAT